MKSRLHISEPCHQNWNRMTILEKGRFCESCNKVVLDFTKQSREEIIKEINGKKEVCGRIYTSQLRESISRNKKPIIYLSKWSILLGLGSVLGITQPIIAKTYKTQIELRENSEWKSILPINVVNDSILIKGKVLDSDNKYPLPGVKISLDKTLIWTQADWNGEFSFALPTNKLNKNNYLVFSYVGFKSKKYQFDKKDKIINININLEVDEELVTTGPVVVVYKKDVFGKIGSFFKSLFSKKTSH